MQLTDAAYERVYRRLGDIAREHDLWYGGQPPIMLMIDPQTWGRAWIEHLVATMLQDEHVPFSLEREDHVSYFFLIP